VAGLTAFYMFRLYFTIFWGSDRNYAHKPHEAPFSMSFALVFLAVMTTVVGFIPFSNYISPDLVPFTTHLHWNIAIPSIAIGVVGIVVAAILYLKPKATADKIADAMPGLYKLSLRKFYIDEIYVWVTHSIVFNSIARPIAWFDKKVVDGSMDGMAWVTNKVSDKTKGLQSGQLQQYAFVMVAGVVGLVLFLLYYLN